MRLKSIPPPDRKSSSNSNPAITSLGMNMTKNEIDMTLSKRGCVERQVGHINPLITKAIQIKTTSDNHVFRIQYHSARSLNRRLRRRNESHSTNAKMADMKTKEKIIRAIDGMGVKLVQIYNYGDLSPAVDNAKLAKRIRSNGRIPFSERSRRFKRY